MLSSFTKVIILHTKLLELFSALTLHCTALSLNKIDERKLDGGGTLKRMRMEISKKVGVLYNQGRYMSEGVCLQGW